MTAPLSDSAAEHVSLPAPILDPVGDEIVEISAVPGSDGEALIVVPVTDADGHECFDQPDRPAKQVFVVGHARRRRFLIVTCWLLSLLAVVLVVAAALGLVAVLTV